MLINISFIPANKITPHNFLVDLTIKSFSFLESHACCINWFRWHLAWSPFDCTCVDSEVCCCALTTSSMKIWDIVVQPVYASASAWPLLQFPTQNPTRTFPLWMLLHCPSMWRWRWSFLPAQLLLPYIERAINSIRGVTLSTIECEIPTTAALVTGSNRKVTSELDVESRLCNNSSWTDNWPPQGK